MNLKIVTQTEEKDDKTKTANIDPKYRGKKIGRNEPVFVAQEKNTSIVVDLYRKFRKSLLLTQL